MLFDYSNGDEVENLHHKCGGESSYVQCRQTLQLSSFLEVGVRHEDLLRRSDSHCT